MTKEAIRRFIKQKRLLLSKDEVTQLSTKIEEKLYNLFSNAKSFLFYYPFKNEVTLLNLAEKLLQAGKTVAFPKTEGKEIIPVAVNNLRELSPGKFSIPEPPLNPEKILKTIDIAFVPGIAFDLNCFRIGYGGGFYDRFLAKWKIGTKIGICFDFQVVEKIPTDPFDVPMNAVITEKREIRRKEWN
ncbi:5-formyltetrahydrofolate cyclo-ligase [Desulfurobacterium pacificum]|uniref:5-formyltetrahydrofolate cyclo-ligase n=1 Tax=Desulfurobacterium pacificum TaxID=240166 RepID=A0ABY1NRP4_9BACT|nr:5-formyltetrahydrofolate cyclo-ligase [Desulfurobacterium pacificum]SMP14323.1 5-formyltetrahydrofolate cyclo-ligase [Desulfurobacterium pacificum]